MIKQNDKIMPYFDIPIQHASAHLLRNMKRAGDQDVYTDLVSRIRAALPECVIRTTIMLGFPGETEEDFENVYSFVERNRFNWMGSFVYSREEGTFAYGLTDEKTHKQLTKEANKRQKKLQKLQERISSEILQGFVGKEYDVLIEELIEGEDLAIGRFWGQAPEVDGLTVVMGRDMVPGQVYRCGITKVNGIDLEAVRI
jgi:ribosomal protein S12 methylthiotransferase